MSYPAKDSTNLTKPIVSDFHERQKWMDYQTTTEERKIIVNSIPAAICVCADDIALT